MALFLLRHCRNTGNLSENFSKYRLHAIQKEIRPRRPPDRDGFPSIQLPRNRFQIFLTFPAHNQSDIRQRVVVDEPIQLGTLLHGVRDRVLDGGRIDGKHKAIFILDIHAGSVDVKLAGYNSSHSDTYVPYSCTRRKVSRSSHRQLPAGSQQAA